MNEINFLPKSFYRTQARQRRHWIEIVCVVLFAIVLTVLHVIKGHELQTLRDYAAEVEAEGTSAQMKLKEVAVLQAEYRKLEGQLSVHRQLTLPIGYTQILAMISRMMPPSIALTDLRIESPRPSQQSLESRLEAKSGAKKGGTKLKAGDEEIEVEPLRIVFGGLSPDDSRIADLMGRLAESPVFRDVKLEYSRSTETEKLVARKFRVSMTVPLDRIYRAPIAKQGVADAH